MTTLTMPLIYERRESVARGGSIFIGLVMALALDQLVIQHEPVQAEEPIRITLSEPAVEPSKPIRQPVQPTPLRQAIQPEPRAVSPVDVAPSPQPQADAVIVPEAPAVPAAKALPRVEELPPVQRNPSAEGRFAQEVRKQIEQKKTYPDAARELGMSGAVEVVYVLDRMGKLLKAEVASTSGYPVLDQAALRAVRSASFSALPADAWVGENQKEFRTKLVFSIAY